GFAATWLAVEDQASPLGDEVRRQGGAEQREPQGGLVREIEVVDGLEEGESGSVREAPQPRLLALSDFFGDEQGQEVPIGPLLLLGSLHELRPDLACVGEVEPLE